MWRRPRKEPLVDVERAVLIAVHLQAAVRTAIRALLERHVADAFADMPRPGGITFAGDKKVFFQNADTLMHESRTKP